MTPGPVLRADEVLPLDVYLAQRGVPYATRSAIGLRAPRRRSAMSGLDGVFVHHSVTGTYPEVAQVQAIQAFHMDVKGWSDIAYNLLVGQSGIVYEGRSSLSSPYGMLTRGGGTGDPEDATFVAVCAIGNFELDQPTPAMLRAYQSITGWFADLGGTTQRGDRDANLTACPGKNLYTRIPFPPLALPPAPDPGDDDMALTTEDKKWIDDTLDAKLASVRRDAKTLRVWTVPAGATPDNRPKRSTHTGVGDVLEILESP